MDSRVRTRVEHLGGVARRLHADGFDTCEDAGILPDLVGAVHPDADKLEVGSTGGPHGDLARCWVHGQEVSDGAVGGWRRPRRRIPSRRNSKLASKVGAE